METSLLLTLSAAQPVSNKGRVSGNAHCSAKKPVHRRIYLDVFIKCCKYWFEGGEPD